MQALQSCTFSQSLRIPAKCDVIRNKQQKSSRPDEFDQMVQNAELAHDAGNLLGALSLYADLLALPGVLSEEYRSYAEEIKLLSSRGNALIERLAGYTRLFTDMQEIVTLPEIIRSNKGLLSKIIGRSINISFGPDASMPISVSREVVERILLNLLKNAAEATPSNGAVTVAIRGEGRSERIRKRSVSITVKDEGAGMSEATLLSLGNSSYVSCRRGRGLGFRIIRELTAKSGGCVDIQSRLGQGTSVTITWFENRSNVA